MRGSRHIRRVKEILRWEGMAGLSSILLSKAGYSAVGCYVGALETAEEQPKCPISIDVGSLGKDDLEDYLAFRGVNLATWYLDHLRAGHTCFAARIDGQLASVSWLSTKGGWLDDVEDRKSVV